METLRNEGILIYDRQGESFRFDPVRAMFSRNARRQLIETKGLRSLRINGLCGASMVA